MNTPTNDNMTRIEQEMRAMLVSGDWDKRPLRSKQFVMIVSHLFEIMRRSGYRPDYTSDLIMEAIQHAQKLVDVKRLIL